MPKKRRLPWAFFGSLMEVTLLKNPRNSGPKQIPRRSKQHRFSKWGWVEKRNKKNHGDWLSGHCHPLFRKDCRAPIPQPQHVRKPTLDQLIWTTLRIPWMIFPSKKDFCKVRLRSTTSLHQGFIIIQKGLNFLQNGKGSILNRTYIFI